MKQDPVTFHDPVVAEVCCRTPARADEFRNSIETAVATYPSKPEVMQNPLARYFVPPS